VTVRGTVTTTRFEDCATSAAVELVASDGGTHRWPTVARDGWAASERIVQFFDLDR
jgi:poly(3-hydroxybutyrate) depolymerase